MSMLEFHKLTLGARAVARCDAFGVPPYSENPNGLTRRFLTHAHEAAVETLSQWMKKAGMSTTIDPAGNLIGRYDGTTPNAPALMIGSHIDSVRDAGRYDGTLGVMLGLSCVETLAAQDRRFPFAIEVVAFGDEEGSRFSAAMIGSRSAAGLFTDVRGQRDSDGISIEDAMENFGLDAKKVSLAARKPEELVAYLEAHIEQGPALEAENLALGVVSGIAAQLRLKAKFTGKAGHAGTTPMRLRQDALAAAAEAILAIEAIAYERAPRGVVGTVGSMNVLPGASNVIPGAVEMTIDVRALEPEIRDKAADAIRKKIGEIARARGIGLEFSKAQDLLPAPCDPKLSDMLASVISDMGMEPFRLTSGAGHDAGALAAITPMAMLFIRCAGGVSHNPAESVKAADVDLAAEAMLRFIDLLERNYKK